ncbi:TonB-dependent receptor plug domain-containing protein [Parahaliea mediterranea]|uniref:TonB-dependent receptor plug domain-containing protein n=1 Tax=Parahaliea mediterranea TaxID=651086 RepID=UPI000E2FEBD9|nr:TonB-dependent receptor [Parahaliea mediterranea]
MTIKHATHHIGLLALALSGVIHAGESAPLDSALETVLVTGNYTPLAAQDFTASASVLDATQLRQLNKRQLGDVLRTVPGVLVEEQGGSGGLTAVSLRGGEANFTQILLDGIPLNDPTNARGGSYDVGNISAVSIERIEVVRGPQSAVYGSDALAGVINLISANPREPRATTLRAELGESGYRDINLASGVQVGELGIALDLASREDDGRVPGSTRDTASANLRLSWQLAPQHRLSGQLRHLEGERSSYPEQSGGPLYAASDALDDSDYRDTTAGLAWEAQLAPRWRSRLAADYFDHREDYQSPGVAPYLAVPPNGSSTDFDRSQLSWVNTLQLAPDYQLNLGADYRDESGESTGYLDLGFPLPTDYTLSRQTRGLFADVHARLAPRLLLQGSARHDRPDSFDSETTLRLGARYQLLPTLDLLANWGEGFKLPSFFALGHGLVGNPDLQPETARGWDAGLQWQPVDGLQVTATAFGNRYRNLVDFDAEAFTNVNRREVQTRGGEWQLAWQATTGLSLQAHATYTDIDVIGEDARLLGRPEWQAGAWLNWAFLPRWHTGLDYQWNSAVPASSMHTGATVVSELAGRQRLDWRLGWQAAPWLELALALDNLLDDDYQSAVGFAAPGRSARLAATLSFGGA